MQGAATGGEAILPGSDADEDAFLPYEDAALSSVGSSAPEPEPEPEPEPQQVASSELHVRLNVGGVPYTTLLSTLTKDPDSMLAVLFRGLQPCAPHAPAPNTPRAASSTLTRGLLLRRGDGAGGEAFALPCDPSGAYILDRDGAAFRHVLNYLRNGEGTPLPTDPGERLLLAMEAEFFLLGVPPAACPQLCPVLTAPGVVAAGAGG